MDANRSNSNCDLDSSSSAAGTADSVPELVVVGSDNSKIIQWEELQQELARLWNLSSALNNAKKMKVLALKNEAVKVGAFSNSRVLLVLESAFRFYVSI